MGFLLSDSEIGDDFAGQSIPEKDFAAVGISAEGLAARDDFSDFNHRVIIARSA